MSPHTIELDRDEKRFTRGTIRSLRETLGEVDTLLEDGRDGLANDRWHRLKHLLDLLELVCPEFGGVIEARYKWYLMGQTRFEHRVIGGFSSSDVAAIEDEMNTLALYLRRSFLRDRFPQFYRRFLSTLEDMAVKADVTGFRSLCIKARQVSADLEARLLDDTLKDRLS